MKSLFDDDKSWKDHWKGMPEYEQEDLSPKLTIKVHFRNEQDFHDFEKLIGQKITKYMVIWHPKAEKRSYANKRWVDES